MKKINTIHGYYEIIKVMIKFKNQIEVDKFKLKEKNKMIFTSKSSLLIR